MSITLGGITLPEDLQWSDEYTGWKVGQVIRPSLSGALIVQEAAMQAGRPVTLQTLDEGSGRYAGVATLAVVEALRASEETAGGPSMALVLPTSAGGTRTLNVRWRRTDGDGFEARPLVHRWPAEPGDYYHITLRLIQV